MRNEHLINPTEELLEVLAQSATGTSVGVFSQTEKEVIVRDEHCPIYNYINSLRSQNSQETMQAALKSVAKFLGKDSIYSIVWHKFNHTRLDELIRMLEARLKPDTIALYLSAIKGVCKYAHVLDIISSKEWAKIQLVKRPASGRRKTHDIPTVEQFKSLVERPMKLPCPTRSSRDSTILHLAGGVGLRRKEIANLSVKSYQRAAKCLEVIGKGNKQRFVQLNDFTIEFIEKWLAIRGLEDGAMFVGIHAKGTLYNKNGVYKPLSSSSIYKLFNRYGLVGTGELHCPPHTLRRAYATWLYNYGIELKTISELLGHSSMATSERYIQTAEAKKRAAVDGLF